MATGQWLMAWKGVGPGVDPAVSTASTAHRCPEASSSQDPLIPNVWAQYRQTRPAAEASSPSPQERMDVMKQAQKQVALAASRAEAGIQESDDSAL